MTDKKTERNAQMYERLQGGETLSAAGVEFGISAGRVAQIRNKLDRMRKHPTKQGMSTEEFLEWYRTRPPRKAWAPRKPPLGPHHSSWRETPIKLAAIPTRVKTCAGSWFLPAPKTMGDIADLIAKKELALGCPGIGPKSWGDLLSWFRKVGADHSILEAMAADKEG